ncbi:MAG: hypothetical protein AAGA54_21470 [Myxococcota bacterium]
MSLPDELRRVYPRPDAPDPDRRDALEAELLAKLPEPSPSAWRRRMLFGGLAGLAFVGACAVPTDYAVDFGHRLAFSISEEDFDPRGLAEHIREGFDGVEELRVSASMSRVETDDGAPPQMSFDVTLDIVGDVDADAVELSLLEHFDALEAVDVESIDATVHGTFGGMLSHRTLGWVVDEQSADEARARILADFAARGLPPPHRVEVQVEEDEGPGRRSRAVRVEVESER